MRDLYNSQIGFRAAIYGLYRYSTPVRALKFGRRQIWLKIKIWNFLHSYILTVYLSFLGHICAHPKFACRAQ